MAGAQASFVGPSSAEISQNSLNSFMQGMQGLAQFGQFATEQNRLNKIEEIKNKTNAFISIAERYGGGAGKAAQGFAQMAKEMPDFFKSQLSLLGYPAEMASHVTDVLIKSPGTAEEFLKATQALGMETAKPEGEAAPAEATTTEPSVPAMAVSQKTTTPAPAEAPVKTTSPENRQAKPANLMGWDQVADGQLGKEPQQAWQVVMALQDKYASKGWKSQEQNMGWEKSRKMFFTPFLADEQMKTQSPTMREPGGLNVNLGPSPQEVAEIRKDKAIFQHNISIINKARYGRGQALAGQGAVDAQGRAYSGLSPQSLAGSMTSGNRTNPIAGGPLTEPVATGEPSSTTEGIPSQKAASSLAPSPSTSPENRLGVKVVEGTASPKEKRQFQSLAEKISGPIPAWKVRELSQSDPEYARELVGVIAHDQNLLSLFSMMNDPNREREFQADLRSGKYQANIDYLVGMSKAAILNAQTLAANQPAQIAADLATAAARVREAEAAMASLPTKAKLLDLELAMARLSYQNAGLVSKSAELAPVKQFADDYLESEKNISTFVAKLAGKDMTSTDLELLNSLIKTRNGLASIYTAQGGVYAASKNLPWSGIAPIGLWKRKDNASLRDLLGITNPGYVQSSIEETPVPAAQGTAPVPKGKSPAEKAAASGY